MMSSSAINRIKLAGFFFCGIYSLKVGVLVGIVIKNSYICTL